MVCHKNNKVLLIFVIILIVAFATPLFSQTYWMEFNDQSKITIEMYKSKYKKMSMFKSLSSSWFMKGRLQISQLLYIITELPVSNADIDFTKVSSFYFYSPYYWDENGTMIGNPYLGIEKKMYFYQSDQYATFRFGFRPPLANDKGRSARTIGIDATFNRYEAFLKDVLTITTGFGFNERNKESLDYSLNFSVSLLFTTNRSDDVGKIIDYNLAIWIPNDKIIIGTGFAGRVGDQLNISNSSNHQIALMATLPPKKINPGLHIRYYLDDNTNDRITFVYGFDLTFLI